MLGKYLAPGADNPITDLTAVGNGLFVALFHTFAQHQNETVFTSPSGVTSRAVMRPDGDVDVFKQTATGWKAQKGDAIRIALLVKAGVKVPVMSEQVYALEQYFAYRAGCAGIPVDIEDEAWEGVQ